ncbi:hypothetical protein FYZ48_16905 [Gimesia chilikensis]|uniref:hypothetical protein n=1 Tax=Gimesia chilikensis TaxID=2605989 RepID=UPI0011ED9DE7|nr:hypothetical protein [Gimesia chilikensis]KAA0135814.1 hypothetical protein FYZ48_16905 [Gimesia chilikensis]
MFFDFLQQRKIGNQLKISTNLLTNISDASDKVEELVKKLYRHLDEAGADKVFKEVEEHAAARKFFEACSRMPTPHFDKSVSLDGFDNWYDYVANATGGTVDKHQSYTAIEWDNVGFMVKWHDMNSDAGKETKARSEELQGRFEVAKALDRAVIKTILDDLF